MSNRKITNEQFSDSSTIDGSRIARAIQDVVEYQNDVPLDAISKPRVPQWIILGAAAPNILAAGITTSPPWLNYNLTGATGTVDFRAKGVLASQTPAGPITAADGGLWTVSTVFDRPVIIDSICVHIDSWVPWPIDLNAPILGVRGEASLLQLIIDTDDVRAPEDRTVNAKEYHYRFYDPTVWEAPDLNNNVAPAAAMLPTPPTALKDGTAVQPSYVIERKDINLPIHQLARVRFRLAFALQGTNPLVAGSKAWESGAGSNTMHPGQPTWTIVYREQLRG